MATPSLIRRSARQYRASSASRPSCGGRSITTNLSCIISRLSIPTLWRCAAQECLSILRQFKSLGISVALDDFGTGYSSLSQLTMFPFDKIKIDKSFTLNMTKRADCAAIISAVLALARSLDITTTAEGVETKEQ